MIAVATVLLAPAMEELFFRGLLLKGLVRVFTKLGAAGGARIVGVVLAIVVDGLLFGLAHGEWVQLAGLALFGVILATVSYRTGRLGMNMVAHASLQPGRHHRHCRGRQRRHPLSPRPAPGPVGGTLRAPVLRAGAPYG